MRSASKSVPVVALVSDLTAASRAGYVGLDNRKVGRTAAWFLSNMLPANSTVSIFVGSHRYLCQEACEIGFRSCLRESAPDFVLIDPVATLESDHYSFEATLDLLRRHPGLAGLYVAGGGIGGVLKAVREAASTERMPTIVGHDLTDADHAWIGRRHLERGALPSDRSGCHAGSRSPRRKEPATEKRVAVYALQSSTADFHSGKRVASTASTRRDVSRRINTIL